MRSGDARTSPDDRALIRREWWRSVALTAVGMTAILVAVGWVTVVLVARQQSAALDAELTHIVAVADDVGDPPPGYYLAQRGDDASVAVTPGAPMPVAALLTSTASASSDDPARTTPHDVAVADAGDVRIDMVVHSDGTQWAIAADLTGLHTAQQDVVQAVLLAEVAGLAGTLAAAALLSRRAVAPLQRALRMQRRFVADASHELRAPLTVLHTRAQMLAVNPAIDHDSPVGRGLNGIVDDTRALGDVVEDLLVSAELDRHPRRTELVDLAELANAVHQSMDAHAVAQGVTLVHGGTAPVLVTGHPAALRRAMTSLVDNAVAHTPPGGTVELGVRVRGTTAEVVVTDTGVGFDPVAVDRMFLRAEHADHGERPRFGLGLALVREIAVAHGGSVTADGQPGRGATFILHLPRYDGRE